MLLAAEEYPLLDTEGEHTRLRTLCRNAALRAAPYSNPFARHDALNEFIFGELGFRGNRSDYEDPRNSYFNDVMDRRLGIPITLSLIYREAAREAGFVTRGVGLPGHYVLSLSYDNRQFLVDPFHQGRVITFEDCRELVLRATGRATLYHPNQITESSDRASMQRLLLNLKRAYLARGRHDKALDCVERLRLIDPEDPHELRDHGFLHAHLGHSDAAVRSLESYLVQHPEATDAASVRGRLAWLKRRLSETN